MNVNERMTEFGYNINSYTLFPHEPINLPHFVAIKHLSSNEK